MERASVATDGDSRTAMDGAKCPLEWVPQGFTQQLLKTILFSVPTVLITVTHLNHLRQAFSQAHHWSFQHYQNRHQLALLLYRCSRHHRFARLSHCLQAVSLFQR
jgi:hypothetical protein